MRRQATAGARFRDMEGDQERREKERGEQRGQGQVCKGGGSAGCQPVILLRR